MTPHEELRALLGKLPNPQRAMELLEQVAAVPVVGESERMLRAGFSRASFHDAAWAAYARKKREDGLLPQLSIHAIRNVFDSIFDSLPPTDSITRARLDELLAAERRLGRVVALAKLVCESSGDNSRSIATVALKMELDVIAALCASKADDCGTSELDLIGGES